MRNDNIISDDIFGLSFDGEITNDAICVGEESLEKDSVDNNVNIVTNNVDLPELASLDEEDYPPEYKFIVKRFLNLYEELPKLKYNEIHREVSQLNVDSSPTPTLQLINLKLQRIQANKDRLAEIYQDVLRCYTFKKRAVNILSEAWGKFSVGSSADKRKADCAFRLSDFFIDLAQVECLHFACEHVLRNLDSASNAISRQITIIQSQLKMFDMGRGALPDFDFNKSSLNEGFETLGSPVETSKESFTIDGSESKEPQELSF